MIDQHFNTLWCCHGLTIDNWIDHTTFAMAVINNLIVRLVLHLGWTNLPEAHRYNDAHPAEARHVVMRQLR